MAILKYIIIKNQIDLKNCPIIFNRSILHKDMVPPNSEVTSAGFVNIGVKSNKVTALCYGKSETLEIESKPNDDNLIVLKELNGSL